MANQRKPVENWFEKVADLMVRRNLPIREAASYLEIPLSTEEADSIRRSKAFEAILWTTRNNYHAEIGRNPGITRDTLVGKMWICAEKLMEGGEFDKAGEVLLKIAKIRNMVGPEQQTNIFGSLSQEDLNQLREKVGKMVGAIQ